MRLPPKCGCLVLTLAALLPTVHAQSLVVQPPSGTFQIRPDLDGQHPRLHFTQSDIPSIRQRALGSCSWFYDKAMSSFGGYLDQRTPDDPGTWKDYLFGFWGQFSMCMFYLVEEDTAYANAARDWALFYARRNDWLADDLIPMDITSGMALTYDILYDHLTTSERSELRTALKRSIDTMMTHIFVGDYYTQDFQNNHMHNRIHGIAHAAFAMYGDDPSIDMQSTADLAVGCFEQVAHWLPSDGSTHEGPGYFDYGYHWAVRSAELIAHVTGVDPVEGKPHFDSDHLFRLYMTTPGWANTFGIGDANEGAPSNVEAWLPAIVRSQDAAADSVFRRLMNEQAGGFYQHSMWGVLWYDPDLQPQSYSSLPLYRFWPDLEVFSIRSSWDDTATAFVFKCGPPGGHRLQQLRGTGWANVAHDHPDQNHFLLFAHGRMLAQDDGYPTDQKLARSHNTITIDGEGQTRDGTGWYQPFDYDQTGFLTDLMLSGGSAVAAGNASLLYQNADTFVRHVAFVEGQCVVSMDELVGAGTGSHTFDWRLHKDGTWSEGQAGQFFVNDTPDVRLDIRFLEPDPASLQSAFLPAELTTVNPCLSVQVEAPSTWISAVMVPQRNGEPSLNATALSATGAHAVQVQGNGVTDVFAVRSGAANFTASDIESDASHVLVRRGNDGVSFAMMTRGTYITVGSASIVSCESSANVSWRHTLAGVTLEAEPAYDADGGDETLVVGGLQPGQDYAAVVGDSDVRTVTADSDGAAQLSVDLTGRIAVVFTPGQGSDNPLSGAMMDRIRIRLGSDEFLVKLGGIPRDGQVWVVNASGQAIAGARLPREGDRIVLETPGVCPGVYLLRFTGDGQNWCRRFILGP